MIHILASAGILARRPPRLPQAIGAKSGLFAGSGNATLTMDTTSSTLLSLTITSTSGTSREYAAVPPERMVLLVGSYRSALLPGAATRVA